MQLELTTPQTVSEISLEPARSRDGYELAGSILAAIVYADLFDYPLTLDELAHYQVGTTSLPREIKSSLASHPLVTSLVAEAGGYYFLKDRPQLVKLRSGRAQASRRLWRRALRYSGWISRMPFVRMVAVTGALAVHNVGALPDIDLLVVAQEDRVWICRRALILLVRVARLLGDDLCPNYVLAQPNLELDQRDFFTAHELAQMVPVYGLNTYHRMLEANAWAWKYLPNALHHRPLGDIPVRRGILRSGVERLLSLGYFNSWERWELRRMQAKLKPEIGEIAEVVCSPTQCKGHTGLHRRRVIARYAQRLEELGLADIAPPVLREG